MAKVILDSLIKRMTRGVLIKAAELEAITSYEKTNNEYLKIGNIDNGLITGDMIYLTILEERFEKYCVRNNNLVITKTGFPQKVLVAQVEEGRNILASGNFFILELDLNQVNPFYLAAYFNSDEGKKKLLEVSVGQFIATINTSKFRALEIDLPELEEQKKIGKEYLNTVNKIAELKSELTANIEKLGHII